MTQAKADSIIERVKNELQRNRHHRYWLEKTGSDSAAIALDNDIFILETRLAKFMKQYNKKWN